MRHQPAITDSDVVYGLSVRYLKFFGLWGAINDYRTTGRRNTFIRLKVLLTLIFPVPYLICQALSFFMIKVDIEKATFLVLHCMPAFQIWCKMLVFWFRLDSICRLYNLVRKDFLAIPECKRSGAKKIHEKITRQTNLLCLTAFLVTISIVSLIIADPGISIDYLEHHTGSMLAVTGGRKKILGGWYPFPMAEPPYYEIIFAYEASVAIWNGTLLVVYICLFYQLLMCLFIQFNVLALHISSLKVDSKGNRKRKIRGQSRNSEIYEELYAILKDHQKLISYANELRSVYNPLVTIILGMGVFLLIIAVFQFLFGGKGSPMFIFKSLQYVAYQGIEVSMFCFGSSSIETASSDLQFAIYSSDWYKADVKYRRTAQMLMLRAKKGVTLTAIRMYPINLGTIMSILQFTYSATALMSRMSEEKIN